MRPTTTFSGSRTITRASTPSRTIETRLLVQLVSIQSCNILQIFDSRLAKTFFCEKFLFLYRNETAFATIRTPDTPLRILLNEFQRLGSAVDLRYAVWLSGVFQKFKFCPILGLLQ